MVNIETGQLGMVYIVGRLELTVWQIKKINYHGVCIVFLIR